jgi:hypothetical protein
MAISTTNGNNLKYFNAINDFNTFKELSDTGICFNYNPRLVRLVVNLSVMEPKILQLKNVG